MDTKVANPKRNLRFLVIYILLLFSVSTIFLVTSFFANRNENLDRLLFAEMEKVAALEQELASMEAEFASAESARELELRQLRELRDGLEEENTELTADIERLEAELAALRLTHESYVLEIAALRDELETLQASGGEGGDEA